MTILHGVTGDTMPGDTEPRRVALRATADGKLLVDGVGGGGGGAAHVVFGFPEAVTLLSEATATGAGEGQRLRYGMKSFAATVTGSGSVAATVQIEISNDGENWRAMEDADGAVAEIDLLGTDAATGGFVTEESWLFHRANVTAISGTGAKVTVIGA